MNNKFVASIAAIPFAVAGVFAGAGAANAAAIIQFDDQFVHGGTLFYDGNGGALTGTNLLLDMVIGFETPSNSDNPLSCVDCKLNFMTGSNISESPYMFGSGGSLSITGTVKNGGSTIASGTFLTGYFTEEIVGSATNSALTFTGIGFDTMDAAISSYFGLGTTDFEFAQTSIALGKVTKFANKGFTGTVTNVDMDNTPIEKTPEPTTLFGLGVVTAGLVASRRKKSS